MSIAYTLRKIETLDINHQSKNFNEQEKKKKKTASGGVELEAGEVERE